MLKIENIEVMGWEAAIRGMRNPMNSWDNSDSGYVYADKVTTEHIIAEDHGDGIPFVIGANDRDLMKRLRNAGTDHRKFMRMIAVYADITAPLYWWKEYDTYKVGTVANSCSTMHKLTEKEFMLDDFSHEHLNAFSLDSPYVKVVCGDCLLSPLGLLNLQIEMLNVCREKYLTALKTEEYAGLPAEDIWWQMIQLLPSSYNQRRTVMLNYEVLANIYKSRKNHKLDEWHVLCDWIKTLPYSELITGIFDEPEEKK